MSNVLHWLPIVVMAAGITLLTGSILPPACFSRARFVALIALVLLYFAAVL